MLKRQKILDTLPHRNKILTFVPLHQATKFPKFCNSPFRHTSFWPKEVEMCERLRPLCVIESHICRVHFPAVLPHAVISRSVNSKLTSSFSAKVGRSSQDYVRVGIKGIDGFDRTKYYEYLKFLVDKQFRLCGE